MKMACSTISLAELAVNDFLFFFQEQVLIRCQGDQRASCIGSVVNNLHDRAGDTGSIPGLGRSPEGGNGNPLQYACLGNPMDRGAWWATVHGLQKSQIQLSD